MGALRRLSRLRENFTVRVARLAVVHGFDSRTCIVLLLFVTNDCSLLADNQFNCSKNELHCMPALNKQIMLEKNMLWRESNLMTLLPQTKTNDFAGLGGTNRTRDFRPIVSRVMSLGSTTASRKTCAFLSPFSMVSSIIFCLDFFETKSTKFLVYGY